VSTQLNDEKIRYDKEVEQFKKMMKESQNSLLFNQVLERNSMQQNEMNDPRCDLFTLEKQ
jgi:hypothetical protein